MKSLRFIALLGVFCAFLTGVGFAETTSTAYLVTTTSSVNDSIVHIINSSSGAQSFTGTLYNGDGTQLGAAKKALHTGTIAPNARLILDASDLEGLFNVPAWTGPAMLEVYGSSELEVMIKLKSPSGFISNTNCVTEDSVQNVEGYETSDITFVRLINTGDTTINNITGTLYDKNGNAVGSPNQVLLPALYPKQQVWIDRWQLFNTFQQEWTSEASLVVSEHANLKLLNLNFVNSETFFNFSCFEKTSATAYLVTTSSSINDSIVHIINSSSQAQSFAGTLYNGDGSQLGSAQKLLSTTNIAPHGRLILDATDLEDLFNVPPWIGPAMLEVYGQGSLEVMTKLRSPSGFISNTNCVAEDAVRNVEGYETTDITFVRLINTGSTTINNITGTMYNKNGNIIGSPNQTLLSTLYPKQQVWIDRWKLNEIFQQEWTNEASLVVSKYDNLKLLNLNFVNSETFFNFSCYGDVASPKFTAADFNDQTHYLLNDIDGAWETATIDFDNDGTFLGADGLVSPLVTAAFTGPWEIDGQGRLFIMGDAYYTLAARKDGFLETCWGKTPVEADACGSPEIWYTDFAAAKAKASVPPSAQ